MADTGLLILRLAVGIVMIVHGVYKFQNKLLLDDKWRIGCGLPQGSVALTGILQVICGLALAVGVYSRFVALILLAVMVVATYVSINKHRESFLSGPQGKGWDINFLLMGALVALIFLGDGNWSLVGW